MRRVRTLIPAILLGLLLTGGLFGLSCGGGGGDPLTLEEYFAEVEVLGQTVDADATDAFDILSSSQDLDELKAAYAELPEAFEDFLNGMQDIDPPDAVADEHQAALDAGEEFLTELQAANDAAQDATTVDEFIASADTPELSQLNATLSDTCDALQAIADSEGIVVDLGCEV